MLVVALALAGIASLSVWQFLGNVITEAEAEIATSRYIGPPTSLQKVSRVILFSPR